MLDKYYKIIYFTENDTKNVLNVDLSKDTQKLKDYINFNTLKPRSNNKPNLYTFTNKECQPFTSVEFAYIENGHLHQPDPNKPCITRRLYEYINNDDIQINKNNDFAYNGTVFKNKRVIYSLNEINYKRFIIEYTKSTNKGLLITLNSKSNNPLIQNFCQKQLKIK